MSANMRPECRQIDNILCESHRRMSELTLFNNDTTIKMDKFCCSVKNTIHDYYENIIHALNNIEAALSDSSKKNSSSNESYEYFQHMSEVLLHEFLNSQLPMIKIQKSLDALGCYAKTIHYENHRLYTDYFHLIMNYRKLLDDIAAFENDNDMQVISREKYHNMYDGSALILKSLTIV